MLRASNEESLFLLHGYIAFLYILILSNLKSKHFSVLCGMTERYKLYVIWIQVEELADKEADILNIVIGFMESGIG